jgi:hypothetical protein
MTMAAAFGMVDASFDSSVLMLPLLSPLLELLTLVVVAGPLQFLLQYSVPYLICCYLLFLLARAVHVLLNAEPCARLELC